MDIKYAAQEMNLLSAAGWWANLHYSIQYPVKHSTPANGRSTIQDSVN